MDNMEKEERSLPRAFRETQILLHRYMATLHRDSFDPERGQGRILTLLKKTGPLPQRDIAYLLGIRQQSLSELVRKLEESGYVTRTQQEEDKRVTVVSLTEKGEELEMPQTPMQRVFDCLDEAEQACMLAGLDKICERLTELLPEEDAEFEDPRGWGPGPWHRHGCHRPHGPHHHGPHHHHHHRCCGPF